MIKKSAFIAMSLVLCALAGCKKQNAAQNAVQTADNSPVHVDFDLTQMNPNMVYAQVFNLMVSPEEYKGKTFKMKGNFLKLTAPDGKDAYAVVIKDALECCQQGLEFKYDFRGNLPENDRIITVTGRYTLTTRPDGLSYNYVTADTVEEE